MWKRKEGESDGKSGKTYEEELKERMEEQFREGKRKSSNDNGTKEEGEQDDVDKKVEPGQDEAKVDGSKKMTLDEIEEIRKKRERFKVQILLHFV